MQCPREPDVISIPGIETLPKTRNSDFLTPQFFHSFKSRTPKSLRIGYKAAVACPLLIKILSKNFFFFSSNLIKPP